jgi:5-methylcytosine-specific restriction endonuclease McrA
VSTSRRHRLAIPHASTARGTCRWCGLPILRPDGRPDRRRNWHPACVETYKLSWPGHAKLRVKERDGGICAACGRDTVTRRLRRSRPITPRPGDTRHAGPYCRAVWTERHAWELDHIVPLADGGGHELGNMQTLCRPCHRAKTAREAAERARRRRAAAQGGTPQAAAHRPGRPDQFGSLVETAPRTG